MTTLVLLHTGPRRTDGVDFVRMKPLIGL
jgi:hypothetical protein